MNAPDFTCPHCGEHENIYIIEFTDAGFICECWECDTQYEVTLTTK